MRFASLTFVLLSTALVGKVASNLCDPAAVSTLLNTLFPSLGNNCTAYAALFSSSANYYHQHDGYRNGSQLYANCQGYGGFCPGGACAFQQNGPAMTTDDGTSCYILAPYIWSELPANNKVPGNLEPHTGFEFIQATPSASSGNLTITQFCEIESTFSAPFNWATPSDTTNYNLTQQLLSKTASQGECDHPVQQFLTDYFDTQTVNSGALWRQQGNAIVLAAGGLCHVAVPYAAQINSTLQGGQFVFTLQPSSTATFGYNSMAVTNFTVVNTTTTATTTSTTSDVVPKTVTTAGAVTMVVIALIFGVFGTVIYLRAGKSDDILTTNKRNSIQFGAYEEMKH